jgi:hypothetical protein
LEFPLHWYLQGQEGIFTVPDAVIYPSPKPLTRLLSTSSLQARGGPNSDSDIIPSPQVPFHLGDSLLTLLRC